MGFMRKALFVSTGGLSGVAGVKANSKKERTAKATEKQVRLQKQQLKAAKSAARNISHQQPQTMQTTSAVPPSPATNPSLAAELERLAALHRDGALSEEEFAAAKGRLLGSASIPPPRQDLTCSVGPCTQPRVPGSNYCPKHGPKR